MQDIFFWATQNGPVTTLVPVRHVAAAGPGPAAPASMDRSQLPGFTRDEDDIRRTADGTSASSTGVPTPRLVRNSRWPV